MSRSAIVAACRTPIGRFQGGLAGLPAPQLAAVAIAEALRRAALPPHQVEAVVFGQVVAAGVGQAPARQAALLAGLPPQVPALTINNVCGSGLQAVLLADQAIRAGDAQAVLAGGMESMSRAPHLLPASRSGCKFGHQQLVDSLLHDGLWCATEQQPMGALAERFAQTQDLSRADQDAWALESHRRAASPEPWPEIVPVPLGSARDVFSRDEGPRTGLDLARLAALPAAFAPHGTITAGNASQLSDGAAALVVVAESRVSASDHPVAARILATASLAVPPADLFLAPVCAVQAVLHRAGLDLNQVDLFELHEAFAAQCLACVRQLGLPVERTNVRGGAIALGHPLGASGARVLVTLLHALHERQLRRGLAALCLGGGGAVALLVERC
jgi:acetyl-CoA C-acetyltransferase